MVVTLCAGLLGSSPTAAEPVLGLDRVTAGTNETVQLPLRLTGGTGTYAGFNASVRLPAVVGVAGVAAGALLPAGAWLHYGVEPSGTSNTVRLAVSSTNGFGGAGELLRFVLTVPPGAPAGDFPVVFAEGDPAPKVNARHALSTAVAVSVAHSTSNGLLRIRHAVTPGDSNGNGIPDDWEILYFGRTTNVTHTTDFDRDGLSDYYEWLAGTSPTDPLSCLRVEALDGGSSGMTLLWYSTAGATYRVERATDLSSPEGFEVVGWDLPATPPVNGFTDEAPPASGPAFYRIVAE